MPPRPLRLQDLNPAQREAVRTTEGPVLILAGAGTGKTRVITSRIAYLLATGTDPEHVLAVTFTNKAANEMRERVAGMVERRTARKVTIATFHSLCVRILRAGIERLGYKANFTIYTASDQLGLIRRIIVRKAGKDEKLDPYLAQALIGRAKNRGIPVSDSADSLVAEVFREYQRSLETLNAVDFDDLLGLAVRILDEHPDVRDGWRERFRFIMVDEFQDTNRTQMDLLRLLGSGHGNVCVVGDDDQSIYGWRGAEVSNILDFERHFPSPHVVKLEENYRSTTPILETANGLIRHNRQRREKRLRSNRDGATKVRLIAMPGDAEEAEMVATEIWEEQRTAGRPWEDFAVLFRMNSQSRLVEEHLRKLQIPYRVVGGQSFFERREVKDLLAYLRVIANPDDDINLLRIINFPTRGISNATVATATAHSVEIGSSIFAALRDPGLHALLARRAREAVEQFQSMIDLYADVAGQSGTRVADIARQLLEETGYLSAVKRQCKNEDEAASRERNVFDLLETMRAHDEGPGGGLGPFLEGVTLDDSRENDDDDLSKKKGVCLITLHAAKGLEFPIVYLVGLEEGILPHSRSVEEGSGDEERRLLYVGITRAMEALTLTWCRNRTRYGEPVPSRPSSFIRELGDDHVEILSYEDLAGEPATEEAAKGYFGMMKARLGGVEGIDAG